jgi:hypothetical protein
MSFVRARALSATARVAEERPCARREARRSSQHLSTCLRASESDAPFSVYCPLLHFARCYASPDSFKAIDATVGGGRWAPQRRRFQVLVARVWDSP